MNKPTFSFTKHSYPFITYYIVTMSSSETFTISISYPNIACNTNCLYRGKGTCTKYQLPNPCWHLCQEEFKEVINTIRMLDAL
jgi:hypothetical protein